MDWVQEDMADLSLGDERLNRRACKVLGRLASAPEASIPQACGGAEEVKGAYRLIEHEDLDWRDLLEPHAHKTLERMRGQPVVLCVQDATELDFNGREATGLGRLSYEAQRGMYVHPTYAVTPARVPLGVLDCWMWARSPQGAPAMKESLRWLEGYDRVADLAAELPGTRLVYVADREADIAALFARGQHRQWAADVLVRVQHNRALDKKGRRLFKALSQAPALGEVHFELPRGRGRKARPVAATVSALTVSIHIGNGETVRMTAVQVIERHPPAGQKAVCWRLLTNRVADTLEAVAQLIDWYRARWEIEQFFNIFTDLTQPQRESAGVRRMQPVKH